jgi:hypothetical protein
MIGIISLSNNILLSTSRLQPSQSCKKIVSMLYLLFLREKTEKRKIVFNDTFNTIYRSPIYTLPLIFCKIRQSN